MFKTTSRWMLVVLLSFIPLALTVTSLNSSATEPASATAIMRAGSVITVTTSIQAAINVAVNGDTVLVPAGIYTESLILSKAVSLTGEAGSAVTIINAVPGQRVLTVNAGAVAKDVQISGLTLRGGNLNGIGCPAQCGGGLLVTNGAGPTLIDSQVVDNVAYDGGGIYVDSGSRLTLINTRITNNVATANGGGLSAMAAITVERSIFYVNTAGSNGGGVHVAGTEASRITNAVVADNTAGGVGSGIRLASTGESVLLHLTVATANLNPKQAIDVSAGSVFITNTIIVSHNIGLRQTGGVVVQDYNLFSGNTTNRVGTINSGPHGQSGDPCFRSSVTGDYHILPCSAASDHAADWGVAIDIDGQGRPIGAGSDIGADEADIPIAGLLAMNGSPTTVFQPTQFSASVSSGTNVQYVWNFGDGTWGVGAVVEHTYQAIGIYTATVSATNTTSDLQVATTVATITDVAIDGLTAVNSSPTLARGFTKLNAIILTGTNVIYVWNFGDGTLYQTQGISVMHTYQTIGRYVATVTATNGLGTNKVATTTIVITNRIQSVVDAASDGDTLIIPAGFYTESLTINKAVTLQGEVNKDSTVIHALPGQRVITVTGNAISQPVVLDRITLYGGEIAGVNCPVSCGGGLSVIDNADVLLRNSTVADNASYLGGGIYADGTSRLTLEYVRLHDNVAQTLGGGLYARASLLISQTAIISNIAQSGAGLYLTGTQPSRMVNILVAHNASPVAGASMFLGTHSPVMIQHATFADAAVRSGEAIQILTEGIGGRVTILYSIFASQTVAIRLDSGIAFENFNVFFNNLSETTGSVSSGANSRNGDPDFVSPKQANYHIGLDSVALDATSLSPTEVDLDGSSRPNGGNYDIGCYEADTPISGLMVAHTAPVAVGSQVSFTASVGTGTHVMYDWDFGDQVVFSLGRVPTISHVYSKSGNFVAIVTATNNLGLPVAVTATIPISNLRTFLPLVMHNYKVLPISGLSVSSNSPIPVNRPVVFTASIAAGNAVIYRWQFGDGTQGAGQTVTHAYTVAGYYTAVVTAFNDVNLHSASTEVRILLSIQDLIDNAQPGQTVLIPPGEYLESIVLTKPIRLVGQFGPTRTVVVAPSGKRALSVVGTVITSGVVISGITFTGGNVSDVESCPDGCGGGIYLGNGAKPALQNLVVAGNAAWLGGGLYADGNSRVSLENVTVLSNTAILSGGGVYAGSYLYASNSVFAGNFAAAGGGVFHSAGADTVSTGRVLNSILAQNISSVGGAALYLDSPHSVSLVNSTIVAASFVSQSAVLISNGTVGITNTIIASHEVGIDAVGGLIYEDYNLFFNTPISLTIGSSGAHDVVGNPDFQSIVGGDYHLGPASMAIERGTYTGLLTDFDGDPRPIGARLEIGADETDNPVSGLALTSNSPRYTNQTVWLTASASSGTNMRYTWNFGDGIVTELTSKSTMTHTYLADGLYTVTVTVTNRLNSKSPTSTQIRIRKHMILLPLLLNNYSALCNGDFEQGWYCWTHGQGNFIGYGNGLPQSIVAYEGGSRALLGSPLYNNFVEGIPVGNAYLAQSFTVPDVASRLLVTYRVFSYDTVYDINNPRYFDTFEVSLLSPSQVTDIDRNSKGCNQSASINPNGILTPAATDALVFCGGGAPGMAGNYAPKDTGWRTVTIDLRNFAAKKISLYFTVWSREYNQAYRNDNAAGNTYVYIDNVRFVP